MSEEIQIASGPDLSEFEMATTSGSLMLAGGNAFAHIQRVAKMFSSSDLVPDAFKGKIANCTIALEMAHRMGANPMAVMQNLYIVHGRPGWSAQFIIACLNQCGKFSPLRFEITGEGDKRVCVAWAKELESGERLEGPPVSIQLAKDEGWLGKSGSKWKTMPDLMLRYRAATFFGRLYAPDLLMGTQTAEELKDTDEKPKIRTVTAAVIPTTLPLPEKKKKPETEPAVASALDAVLLKLESSGIAWDQVRAVVIDNGDEAAESIEDTPDATLENIVTNWEVIQEACGK